jgi:microcystin-dependent protein
MMAATAKYRDDIAGAIVTSGASQAYAISSFQVFDSLADMSGKMIAFAPHTTNGAGPVTLNVDGLGAKLLRTAPNVDLLAGVLIQGTPYLAVYNNNDGAFYLHGFYGNPYNMPLLGGMDFWDTVAPNSMFIFPQGQAISRTTYAAAFARWGTKFGAGDGSTTFNVPNKMGKVSAMIESAQNLLTPTYFGADSTQLGSIGGSQSHTLVTAELPPHQHSVFLHDPGHTHSFGPTFLIDPANAPQSGGGAGTNFKSGTTGSNTTGITIGSVNGTANDNQTTATGSGNAHAIVQPTITCNYIIRIL